MQTIIVLSISNLIAYIEENMALILSEANVTWLQKVIVKYDFSQIYWYDLNEMLTYAASLVNIGFIKTIQYLNNMTHTKMY